MPIVVGDEDPHRLVHWSAFGWGVGSSPSLFAFQYGACQPGAHRREGWSFGTKNGPPRGWSSSTWRGGRLQQMMYGGSYAGGSSREARPSRKAYSAAWVRL